MNGPGLYLCGMNIFKVLFQVFLFYLLYKFIFDFIIPVYRTTKQMKHKMADMQAKMQEAARRQEAFTAQQKTAPRTEKVEAGDYIDYEEVK